MLLEQVFEEFLIEQRINGKERNTVKTYEIVFKRFMKNTNVTQFKDFNSLAIKQYKTQMIDEGLSPHTVNNNLRHLRVFVNWCGDEEQSLLKPFKVKMVKANYVVKDIYNEVQLKRILKKPLKSDSFITWRCWMVASVLSNTGMRSATMLRVKWSDISMKFKTMSLTHTKNDPRTIPMSDELIKALMVYRRTVNPQPDHYLIGTKDGKQIKSRTLQQTMAKYHQQRAIYTNSLHQYRRTFITMKLMEGHDSLKIARMVGHSDLQMIHKHYVPHQPELLRDLVKD